MVLALWLAGCTPDYTNVDDACPDHIYGESFGADGAVEFFTRASCYRRLAGLPSFEITEAAQKATSRHVSYMTVNEVVTADEDPTLSGFTGADPWARLADAGSVDVTSTNSLLWYGVLGPPFPEHDPYFPADGPERVDRWMSDPIFRQVILQPSLRAAGFTNRDQNPDDALPGYTEVLVLAELPPSGRSNTPILYPVDGQVDVPREWVPEYTNGITAGQTVGYPITITVGDDGLLPHDENPPDLRGISSTLTGPSGDVAVKTWGSANTVFDMPYTISFIPYEPLEPDADYTFEARIHWTSKYGDVSSTFHTAAE
jgi:hypothetical protein